MKRRNPKLVLDAHGPCEQAGPARSDGGERVTSDELIQIPATWGARGEPTSRARGRAVCFGRKGTVTPGTLVARGARAEVQGAPAASGLGPLPLAIDFGLNLGRHCRRCPGGALRVSREHHGGHVASITVPCPSPPTLPLATALCVGGPARVFKLPTRSCI